MSVTSEESDSTCVSLLAAVGEIILPGTSRLITRSGIERADRVAADVTAGTAVRLETVRPVDTFAMRVPEGSKRSAYRAALAAFPRRHIAIPANLHEESGVGTQIEEVLATAEVSYRQHRTEDWLAFSFAQPCRQDTSTPWPRPGDQAWALRLITAWSLDGGEFVSRVLFDEVSLLQRLTGSLAAARHEYGVKWLPGYRPVEAHILPGAGLIRSHVPVARAVRRHQEVFRVSVEGTGSLVLGCAIAA
jgi:hypothetical protein